MDGAGNQLLARSRFTLDEDSSRAGRQGGQEVEHRAHRRTVADEVACTEASFQLFPQRRDLAQIAEGLGPADDRPGPVTEHGGRDAHRDAVPLGVYYVPGFVDDRLSGLQRALEGTLGFAHA